MKKAVTWIIVFAMVLSLAACGIKKEEGKTDSAKDVQAGTQATQEEDTAEVPEREPAMEPVEETSAENEELTVV